MSAVVHAIENRQDRQRRPRRKCTHGGEKRQHMATTARRAAAKIGKIGKIGNASRENDARTRECGKMRQSLPARKKVRALHKAATNGNEGAPGGNPTRRAIQAPRS